MVFLGRQAQGEVISSGPSSDTTMLGQMDLVSQEGRVKIAEITTRAVHAAKLTVSRPNQIGSSQILVTPCMPSPLAYGTEDMRRATVT